MFLNNLSQSLAIWFSPNFFYPHVQDAWLPVLRRRGMPYLNMEDFANSCIQSISFAGINAPAKEQQIGLYKISKRPGYAMDQLMDKTFTLTFKLTESYISYFVMRQQFEEFLALFEVKELYMPPISVSLLDDDGFETIAYEYCQLTPTNLSEISLSYAARLGQFNTFTMNFAFNYFNIYYRNEEGVRVLLSTSESRHFVNTRNLSAEQMTLQHQLRNNL